MNRRHLRCWIVAPLLLAAAPAPAQDLPLTLDTRAVPLSESLADGATIGRIRFRGMLSLPTVKVGGVRMSQLSALAWDDDEGVLYALSDKGYLFHLKPEIKNDMLTGVTLLKTVALTEPKDGKPLKGRRADTEGMDIVHGRNGRTGDAELLVSFERTPRIVRYRPDGKALGELSSPAALANPAAYDDPNRMLEAVCVDPLLGVLTTPEAPLVGEPEGTTRIFGLSGKVWRYPVTGTNRITAMECLGDGRVLVLERDFRITRNLMSIRLATLPATPTAEPVAVAVTTVVTLDRAEGYQIDNFEGLTRHKGNRFFIVSDDNDLFVQRTLLLYFELIN